MSLPPETEQGARDERIATIVLVVLSALFLGFLWLSVPRLTNYVMSDREFTGWVGPLAERIRSGERPYLDFVLPIPPGSMAVLAAIQAASGKALLLQELWVAGLCHWVMGLFAYAMAACFSTRKIALLVAAGTLVLVVQTPKECVYDHTSQLCAWGSITAGVYALFADDRRRRAALWSSAGAAATFTLFFKQSTATGIVVGWALAFGYLIFISWKENDRARLSSHLRDGLFCAAGGGAGLAAVTLGLGLLGSNLTAFGQAVFADAADLKGGRLKLLQNLYRYVFRDDAIRVALVPTAIVMAIGLRIARRDGGLHLGDERTRGNAIRLSSAAWITALIVAVYGSAIVLLLAHVRELDRYFSATVETLRNVPAYGFVFAALFFVSHSLASSTPAADRTPRRTGHAFNAFVLVAMTSSMIYNTSFVEFRPFYYNNPSIVLALLFLFIATDRARVPGLLPFTFALSLLPTFGTKLDRQLSADIRVTEGQWAGTYVNYRGVQVLKAAERVRQLTEPDETVLVLPEDMQLVGLIGRPRPPILGAVVFVDQYARRLLEEDRNVLGRHKPKVIVVHPRKQRDWQAVFNTWQSESAAEDLIHHVLSDLLPEHYRRDSSYPTVYFWDQGRLDVYVRASASSGATE